MRPFGLRPQLLAALVLVPVISLAVGATVLVPTLKDHLRQSSLDSLLGTTEESRAAFREADLPGGAIDRGQLVHAGDKLAERAGAHVVVRDETGDETGESGDQHGRAQRHARARHCARRAVDWRMRLVLLALRGRTRRWRRLVLSSRAL